MRVQDALPAIEEPDLAALARNFKAGVSGQALVKLDNLESRGSMRTIGFRQHTGTLDAERVITWVQVVTWIVERLNMIDDGDKTHIRWFDVLLRNGASMRNDQDVDMKTLLPSLFVYTPTSRRSCWGSSGTFRFHCHLSSVGSRKFHRPLVPFQLCFICFLQILWAFVHAQNAAVAW